jgi:PPK2 family polyphosphate:nucleotide phosphotransferase
MPDIDDLIDQVRVPHGRKVRLEDYDPGWAGDPAQPKAERKRLAEELLSQDVTALAEAQDRLYAADRWSILIILQAMDAAGKDSTIKHVMSGVNPQGCEVTSFKHPSAEELDHNFLWRYARRAPERGRIGIFNRSYFEEVLVVRVHPELVQAERIPGARIDDDFWDDRHADINAFERHLTRNGTLILKFFLHISREEQRKRFLKRLKDPRKQWKFSPADLGPLAHHPGRPQVGRPGIRRPDRDPGRRVARPPLPGGDRRAARDHRGGPQAARGGEGLRRRDPAGREAISGPLDPAHRRRRSRTGPPAAGPGPLPAHRPTPDPRGSGPDARIRRPRRHPGFGILW